MLPAILRGWFGEEAGRPGRAERVVFERRGDEYVLAPYHEDRAPGPPPWERFLRADILKQFGSDFRPDESQVGVVQRTGGIFLMVTLEKRLEFERWEGEKPITVWWKMERAVPRELWGELGVPGS